MNTVGEIEGHVIRWDKRTGTVSVDLSSSASSPEQALEIARGFLLERQTEKPENPRPATKRSVLLEDWGGGW
jgi:hypothetical protein